MSELNHIIAMGETSAQQRYQRKGGSGKQANGSSMIGTAPTLEEKLIEKSERERLVVWRQPVTTLHYFVRECGILGREYMVK